jgi:hypothetical protein
MISVPRRIGCSVQAAALLMRSTTHAKSAIALSGGRPLRLTLRDLTST